MRGLSGERTRFWRAVTVAMLLAAVSLPHATRAQGIDRQHVAQVKSAYLLNFVRYTEWPATRLGESYVITVVGRSYLGKAIDQAIASVAQIDGRTLRIRRLRYPAAAADGSIDPTAYRRFFDELSATHVLFVGRSETRRVQQLIERAEPGVLTISDIRGFARAGGMIELVLERGRVVFEANPQAIDAAGLRVSSKALKLAHALHGSSP